MTARSDFNALTTALANAAAAIAAAQVAAVAVGIDIVPTPPAPTPIALNTIANVSDLVGTAITSITPQASGGTPPYAFSVSGLPAGLAFANGAIAGTPTAAGVASVVVSVMDSGSPAQTASESFSVAVTTPVTPPPVTSGVSVTKPTVTGGPPPVRGEPGSCYHPGTGLIYYACGNSNAGQLTDTWSLDPAKGVWTKLAATVPGNTAISIGYDPHTKCLILFGGDNNSTSSNATYSLDPTAATPKWTKLAPATSPAVRSGHAVFSDPITGEMLIYGGNQLGVAAALDDLWRWNGTNWVEVSKALTGTPRTGAFAATLTNGTAVIFGGNGSGLFNDTHIWNGTTCTKASPAISPPARRFGGGAPTADGRVLIYGGCNADFSVNSSDCWIWDGTNWSKQTPTGTTVGGLSSQAMNLHPPTGKIVMVFGTAGASASSMGSDINTVYEFTAGASTPPVTPPPVTPPPVTPPPVIPPVVTGAPILGLYIGGPGAPPVQAYAETLGVTCQAYGAYDTRETWADIADSTWVEDDADGMRLICGVGLCPNGVSLTEVPANVKNFATFAAALAPGTIVRLGWEFDGGWYAWGINYPGNTPASYAAAWQAVVPAMRAVQPGLIFDFCSNAGSSQTMAQLEAFYPGDEYVDYIGCDHYDNAGGGGAPSPMTPVIQLAAARGKPFSCGEWGLSGADNPTFINEMAQVFLDPAAAATKWGWPAYTVAYQSYFSAKLSIDSTLDTSRPNSLAAYKAAFAGE